MEVILDNDKIIYKFYHYDLDTHEREEDIGIIIIKTHKNKQAELIYISFIKGYHLLEYWTPVKNDLLKKKYKFIFSIVKENMKNFDEKLNKYKGLGFVTNFKKLPVAIYYKDNEVYRIISVYMKFK